MKKILLGLALIFICLIVVYLLGPKPEYKKVNNTPIELGISLENIEDYIQSKEGSIPDIKAKNEAHILWADSTRKTEYAFVYLHGFTASHGEAHPIIQNIAKQYKSNTFLSRIHSHGLNDKDAFLDLTPTSMIESAKEAIAIGRTIGHKVIVMSCSTGSTYSAYLAPQDPAIVAQIMLAPNFDLQDPNTKLLVKPWGKQIMKKITGGNYRDWGGSCLLYTSPSPRDS